MNSKDQVKDSVWCERRSIQPFVLHVNLKLKISKLFLNFKFINYKTTCYQSNPSDSIHRTDIQPLFAHSIILIVVVHWDLRLSSFFGIPPWLTVFFLFQFTVKSIEAHIIFLSLFLLPPFDSLYKSHKA